MSEIKQFLKGTVVGEPSQFGNLMIFPVKTGAAGVFPYLVFEEAVKNGILELSESGPGGHVPELIIENKSDHRVFILDGQVVQGLKQNRMVNASIMLEARSKTKLPVSCVEQGRWSYRKTEYYAGDVSYGELRKMKQRHVAESLMKKKGFETDQGAIWQEIDRKMQQCDARSQTQEMGSIYEKQRHALEEYLVKLPYTDGATGVIASPGGSRLCADLFDSESTLRKLYTRLISSYALDTIRKSRAKEETQYPDIKEAASFLECLARARAERFKSAGLGEDVRFKGKGIEGASLVCEGSVIHMSLFGQIATAWEGARKLDIRDEAGV